MSGARWRWPFLSLRFAALALLGIAACGRAQGTEKPGNPSGAATSAMGKRLSGGHLRDLEGRHRSLDSVLAGRPTLLLVVSREDCLSCANYPLEVRILRNRLPQLQALFVATGTDTAFFARYFREQRMAASVVLDPEGRLLAGLGAVRTPVLALVSPAGRVVFVDERPGPAAAGFPVSRVFPELVTTLDRARAVASRPREPAGAGLPAAEDRHTTLTQREAP